MSLSLLLPLRHSLLPEEERKAHPRSEDSALVTILKRLQALLSLVKCEHGSYITSNITSEHFVQWNLRVSNVTKLFIIVNQGNVQIVTWLKVMSFMFTIHCQKVMGWRVCLVSLLLWEPEFTSYTFTKHAQFIQRNEHFLTVNKRLWWRILFWEHMRREGKEEMMMKSNWHCFCNGCIQRIGAWLWSAK